MVSALVDSSAAVNLINQHLVEELCLATWPCETPLHVMVMDNRHIGKGLITRRTLPLTLQVGMLHFEEISFSVISSPSNPIVLGFPWLQHHDPSVSWKEGELTNWSPYCLDHSIRKVLTRQCLATSIETMGGIQQRKGHATPPHCSWDCTIDLLPNAMPPKYKVYPLSLPESKAMEEYIKELP